MGHYLSAGAQIEAAFAAIYDLSIMTEGCNTLQVSGMSVAIGGAAPVNPRGLHGRPAPFFFFSIIFFGGKFLFSPHAPLRRVFHSIVCLRLDDGRDAEGWSSSAWLAHLA